MNEFDFLPPSDRAIGAKAGRFTRKYNFPFDSVPVGMSFAIKRDEVKNVNVLRTTANRFGERLNRKFKVIDHGADGYEVFHVGPRTDTVVRAGWGQQNDV